MQNPAPSGAGFSDVTDTGDFLRFRSTGGAQTLSRRPGGETLQGFPTLRTPEIFSPFRSTGGTQTLSRRPGGETLQGFPTLRTPEIFYLSARPEVRRRSLAAPAARLCKAFRRYGHRRFFSPFRSTGGTQTLPRRPGGETLQGFPALRTPEIFSPFRSTGGAQTRSAPTSKKRAWKLASMHVFYLCLPAAQAWPPCAG